MNVISERGVKMENQTSRRKINLVYFLFWTSLYQLICVGSLFWLDILPWYGHVDSISEFGRKYVFFFSFNILFVCYFIKQKKINKFQDFPDSLRSSDLKFGTHRSL